MIDGAFAKKYRRTSCLLPFLVVDDFCKNGSILYPFLLVMDEVCKNDWRMIGDFCKD